ncbi:MAG: serine/threonine protein kinase [Pirellulales bacterium]|nr:serine/threonine protein kinase [Pirellulales bacterium]
MGLFGNFKLKSLLGSRLDVAKRFELLREAISGTMSETYMARERSTGKIVALKLLDVEKTVAFESRFKGLTKPSEGAIAVTFDHPHIVKTYEHGLTTRGQQYLVMEFLDGPGLNSLLIGRDRLLDGRRLQMIRQSAEAIAAVHAAGYIHRDICPRNLMCTDKTCSTVKLIDFGLTVPATAPFMQPGNRTGTPNYMAPELVKRLKTDQRLDVFSFGVTAYEILTFELPWERGATGQIAMTHANQPPKDVRSYRPRIDPVLAAAIMSCVEQNPAKRCPSIEQFLKAIKKVPHEDTAKV